LVVTRRDDQILIEVRDGGPVLAQTDVMRLFERSVLNGDGEHGLELALVKAIAERMGGQVWAAGYAMVMCLPAPQLEVVEA
jgi:signal transduction histidine kinase